MGRQIYFLATNLEPLPVCVIDEHGARHWQTLPWQEKRTFVVGEGTPKEKKAVEAVFPRTEFLNTLNKADTVYTAMGGAGEAFKIGCAQRGARVMCVSRDRMKKYPGKLSEKFPATLIKEEVGRKPEEQKKRLESIARMIEIIQDVGELDFRPYLNPQGAIGAIRVQSATRTAIQDELRKRLEIRMNLLAISQSYMITEEVNASFKMMIDFVGSSQMVESMKNYEGWLERQSAKQLRTLPEYTKVLQPVRGISTNIGARLIAAIIDIERFPTLAGFLQYAGYSVVEVVDGDGVPRKAALTMKRRTSNGKEDDDRVTFSQDCFNAAWLFGPQIIRNKSQFSYWYYGYKSRHEPKLGSYLYRSSKGNPVTLSKGILHKRALRYAVQKFLKYVWFGLWELKGKTFITKARPDIPPSAWGQPFTAADLLHPEDFYGKDFFRPESREKNEIAA